MNIRTATMRRRSRRSLGRLWRFVLPLVILAGACTGGERTERAADPGERGPDNPPILVCSEGDFHELDGTEDAIDNVTFFTEMPAGYEDCPDGTIVKAQLLEPFDCSTLGKHLDWEQWAQSSVLDVEPGELIGRFMLPGSVEPVAELMAANSPINLPLPEVPVWIGVAGGDILAPLGSVDRDVDRLRSEDVSVCYLRWEKGGPMPHMAGARPGDVGWWVSAVQWMDHLLGNGGDQCHDPGPQPTPAPRAPESPRMVLPDPAQPVPGG